MQKRTIHILIADDDEDDRLMTQQAFLEGKLSNSLSFVRDGQELMDYLLHKNGYNAQNAIEPGIILLDLNMPKKDGRECLKEIKTNENLKHIPTIILTTSKSENDIIKSYKLGVNSFIVKPVTFSELVKIILQLNTYWFELVELPE